MIPTDWEYSAIGDKIDYLSGFAFKSSGYKETGIRLLRCANVKRGVTDWSEGITKNWTEVTPKLKRYEMHADKYQARHFFREKAPVGRSTTSPRACNQALAIKSFLTARNI